MRKQITDRDCLRAAEKTLADHLDTRPATKAEAEKIAADYRSKAAYHRETAKQLRSVKDRTAAERVAANGGVRGPAVIEMQHKDGRMIAKAHQQASHEESMAAKMDMHAEAWERVAAGPEGAAWEETRKEYQGRVDFYRNRASQSASVLGSMKSEAKSAAARRNGALGGRPRKTEV